MHTHTTLEQHIHVHLLTHASPPLTHNTHSFPLAHYTREFITSVVLGNDLIPRYEYTHTHTHTETTHTNPPIQLLYSNRVTYRSLLYLKRQVLFLLKNCKVHKMQVLCLPRWVDHYFPRFLRECLFGKKSLPESDLNSIQAHLKEVIRKREEEMNKRELKRKTSGSDGLYGPSVARKLGKM